jgi:signal transduction histidine kinase
VSIDSLLAAAARLQPLADQRGLRIAHDIAPGTPPVAGDPRALAQVMRNLVHNAIKFTPSGGLITIAARQRPDDEQTVELRVADTGVGIPSGELQRIFERFYKADKSRQRDGEGTGLGLAIARHTVEACGGRISAESVAGQGSVFLVELPAALKDSEGHRRPAAH